MNFVWKNVYIYKNRKIINCEIYDFELIYKESGDYEGGNTQQKNINTKLHVQNFVQ